MKTLTIVLFAICTISVYAEGRKQDGIPAQQYQIISDTLDPTIPEGKCVVYGNAYFMNSGLAEALVATCDSKIRTHSDEEGEFSIEVSDQDSCLYLFKSGHDEIITENISFRSQHRIHLNFYASQNPVIITVDKPVIYLYGTPGLEGSIELNPKSDFTFTYPEYDLGWDFVLGSREDILIKNKNYPYLFWEGETSHLDFSMNQGSLTNAFQVNTDSITQFLEAQLTAFGLNEKEQADFITYWGPRIIRHPYATIQFIWGEDYDEMVGEITVNPKPTSELRLFMLFKGSEDWRADLPCTTPQYPKFQRSDFTLIEWGGSELPAFKKTTP